MDIENETLAAIRHALLSFYQRHKRDLPWRHSRDPYAIWVSEIMLQQTQVDTVVPRYHRFLQQFPTVNALAAAREEEVCEAWAGLGYYRRARNLHKAAGIVAKDFAGQMPRTRDELLQLPGIGRYTAGAIASIAFGEEAPIVDGNVVRVLARVFKLDEAADVAANKPVFWELAQMLVRGEMPGDFNQAMMELGATVCTPTQPTCLVCPLRDYCGARASGEPTRYPAPSTKVAKKELDVAFAWIKTQQGVWLERRPLEGLWAGLWELPSSMGASAKSDLSRKLGRRLGSALAQVEHTLTHRQVTATVYQVAKVPEALSENEGRRLFADPLEAPLSALARKAIMACLQE